jgi:hypothetical protein
VIAAPTRLAYAWLLAAAGTVAVSAVSWSGDARPWDGVELWQWTVALAVAGAVAAAVGTAGPARLRFAAVSVGSVLALVALAMWLREWWLIANPASQGWWTFGDDNVQAITVSISDRQNFREPSETLTAAGYAAGALLLVAAAASVVTVARLAPPRAQPAG